MKIGKRKEARRLLEKSLELDFSPLPETNENPEQKTLLFRCRKLEMLGQCCVKGEEKVCFPSVPRLIIGCFCFDFGGFECSSFNYFVGLYNVFGTDYEE